MLLGASRKGDVMKDWFVRSFSYKMLCTRQ